MYIKILPKTFCRGRKGQANWHFVGDSEWMGVLKVKCAGGGRGRGRGEPLACIEEYSYSSIAQSVKFRHSPPNEKFVPERRSGC